MTKLRKKFPIVESNPRLATFFGVSLGVFIFSFFLFTFTYFVPKTEIVKAEEPEWSPPSGENIVEVHIANNGLVYLQGARVDSILPGKNLIVSISWNATKLQWKIHTNESYFESRHFGTNFFDSKGNRLSISNIRVGSIVSVNGLLDVSSTEPAIDADVIRTSY